MITAEVTRTFELGGEVAIRRIGFGAMRVTGPGIWGDPPDREGAKRLLKRVVELGINLIDTADSYGPEVSENLIAEALHPYPDDLVIATKCGLVRPGPQQWERDGHPKRLREACQASLRRLRLDCIPLYQLHAIDPRYPLEDQVGVLAELAQEGKIRFAGLSNVSADELEAAQAIVDVVSVQNRYSIADRVHEPVLRTCGRKGLGFLPWYPVAAGQLAGAGGALARVAKKHGATTSQIALAWLLARSPVMLPIPGTSKIEHLEENTAAESIILDREDLAALDSDRG